MKLYNAVFISRDLRANNMALSAYMTELQSFNVIDKDHRKREAWVEENSEKERDATATPELVDGLKLEDIELRKRSPRNKMEKLIVADLNLYKLNIKIINLIYIIKMENLVQIR